jgi:hypothetical protein
MPRITNASTGLAWFQAAIARNADCGLVLAGLCNTQPRNNTSVGVMCPSVTVFCIVRCSRLRVASPSFVASSLSSTVVLTVLDLCARCRSTLCAPTTAPSSSSTCPSVCPASTSVVLTLQLIGVLVLSLLSLLFLYLPTLSSWHNQAVMRILIDPIYCISGLERF